MPAGVDRRKSSPKFDGDDGGTNEEIQHPGVDPVRASTLFALTAAVVLGLVVATVAKYTGFFNPPPAPVAAVPKKQDFQVLVAAKNLFAGDTILATGVKVRTLRAEEVDEYLKVKDQYMPAVPQAAVLRIPNKNIYADQPILKSDLKEMVKPEALNARLVDGMRAVNLSIPMERSAGGQIQVGEWIDRLTISRPADVRPPQARSFRSGSVGVVFLLGMRKTTPPMILVRYSSS